jgi:hypothetical protein
MYYSVALVSGRGPFPTDMLRYDRCSPYSPGDVGVISSDWREPYDATDQAKLIRFGATKASASSWTIERWRSFGWTLEVLETMKSAG